MDSESGRESPERALKVTYPCRSNSSSTFTFCEKFRMVRACNTHRKSEEERERGDGKVDSNKTHINAAPLFIINMQNKRSPALLSLIVSLRDYDGELFEIKMSN